MMTGRLPRIIRHGTLGTAIVLCLLAPPGAGGWAQSPGGLSGARTGAQINEAESRALLQVGRQGGDLVPQDTLAECDNGISRVGKKKERDVVNVPTSLVDEMKERDDSNTVILGNVYSLGCK